jgi:hypothetical protein
MSHVLDNYAYPLDPRPGGFTGVRPPVVRTDVVGLGSNTSLIWPGRLADAVVREEWEQMDAAQFATFDQKYRANGGGSVYTWSPGDGHSYTVEIVSLDGRAYKGQTYVNVVMQLKVHAQVT